MLRFKVYQNGQPAQDMDLDGAFVFGQDQIPVRADLTFSGGEITCIKRTPGACGLAVLSDAGPSGRFLLYTTRLPERKQPYLLNLELVRGQLGRLAQKFEDWGLFDYPSAADLIDEFNQTKKLFIQALQAPDEAESWNVAEQALAEAITLGEKVALFHAEILLQRRRGVNPAQFGCRIDLFSSTQEYYNRLRESMDFVSIPVPWKHTEPKENNYQYSQIDSWINWAARARRPVHAGPLLSFEPDQVPDWLYIWEHDYEALRDLIYEHIQRVVKRYERQVRVWNVVSGLHAFNNFNLTFDQLMELTRMSCLLVKKLAPRAQVMIDLALPWGEYYARNQRTIPPLLYADMAVQSGVKFDAFGLKVFMGVPVDGYFVRDLLQISSLLDEFVGLSKSMHVTACQVPAEIIRDEWDHWSGQHEVTLAGQWHAPWSARLQAEWLQAFSRVAISKPYLETICWQDLADYEGHFIPHGGLCKNNLEPKLSFRELRNFRAFMASKEKPANGGTARSVQARSGGKDK
ncbi:MAG: endo-1,4-beta-xylanase [Phycisphaerae bacterium]